MNVRKNPLSTLGEMSDAWLVGRARELNAVGQHSDSARRQDSITEADQLLAEAQRRGEPRIVAQLIRHCATLRLSTPGLVETSDPLLDELLDHTRRHGLIVLEADARALRGRRSLLGGNEDVALSEIADALAMLEEDLVPDATLGRRSWERLLATALADIGLVLSQIGVYEQADAVMTRAHHRIRESGGPHEIAAHMINRCRILVGWGFRLERIGQVADAMDRFSTASKIANAVEGLWRESLFPRIPDLPAAVQMPILGTAHALAKPSAEHLGQLEHLRTMDRSMFPREKIILAIALARCLNEADRPHEATEVLHQTYKEVDEDSSEPTLRISLIREYAHQSSLDTQARTAALQQYAFELEGELVAMRETRVATLKTRLKHAKLDRSHKAITKQALHDPLTGLHNRRALDDRLEALLVRNDAQPLSVALVDLDGFKEVNDRSSHAEGDKVLRVIASTLRDTLRTDDMVARYGGDEFVVLLPNVTLSAADTALSRAVEAVSDLPQSLTHGVTLSIGVVSMRPQESSAQVLARADAAMYVAKNDGGNRVAAYAQLPSEFQGDAENTWTPPVEP